MDFYFGLSSVIKFLLIPSGAMSDIYAALNPSDSPIHRKPLHFWFRIAISTTTITVRIV